jgi:hypothetical protein
MDRHPLAECRNRGVRRETHRTASGTVALPNHFLGCQLFLFRLGLSFGLFFQGSLRGG